MIAPANHIGKRILLVDDSKSARLALRALLQKRGLTVDVAESAEAALQMIHDSPPDAVFMDHMMPGMDGHAATAALKADPATAHIPIVMCTSNDQPEHVRKAKALGALGVLAKPPTAEALTDILAALDRQTITPPPADHRVPTTTAPTKTGSQELQSTLRAILPALIEEATKPLIERSTAECLQVARNQVAGSESARIDAIISKRLAAAKADWSTELSDSVERQVVAESVSLEQRLEKTLLKRLEAIAQENQREIGQRILADEDLRASLNASATATAEQLASAVAHRQAEQVARDTVEARVSSLVAGATAKNEQRIEALRRKVRWLTMATVLLGVIGVVALFLLATA